MLPYAHSLRTPIAPGSLDTNCHRGSLAVTVIIGCGFGSTLRYWTPVLDTRRCLVHTDAVYNRGLAPKMEEPLATHISPENLFNDTHPTSMSPDPTEFKMEMDEDDFTMPPPHTSLSVNKPVKKRKSWGQELPEPKTTLPPRKRAKTDDEKEQRRIERIKRNRAAAHNSRERKRVEAEGLAVENTKLRVMMERLQRSLAQRDAQLAKCKELLPNGLPDVPVDDSPYDDTRLVYC